ncbi:LAlv9 family protein-like protein [Histomonas meleagridis]|uniref:LAlv9 family protein-like protein n=1 Tax=Histomonas meleagridis TaxID=135588 RepID=UPI003559E8B3|nr:LAlv9 family protein-like protein [Histomonas meleagridis]KAH0806145.1 LAlv9 family protein-like protein [Histomonas meleagridis]
MFVIVVPTSLSFTFSKPPSKAPERYVIKNNRNEAPCTFMLHIVALSFEHRVGNTIDAVYPPFPDEPYISEWNLGLPFIAIPDKAHDACSSIIQFTLPNPNRPLGCDFGIAAYRAIDASELSKDPSIIRNQVQKAICVISSVPLFGELEKPLKSALYDNFSNLVEALPNIFNSLSGLVENRVDFSGVSYTTLFQALGVNVITVMKALMLQMRVLIFADNSEMVSKMAVAIASLLPCYLSTSNEEFPFNFLAKNQHKFCFAPYVPLQFTDSLNTKDIKSALMGTCSELFMLQKIVDYDILINCKTLPATLTGKRLQILSPTENESKFMDNVLRYMKKNWAKPDTPEWLRQKFREWFNSLFTSILCVRHIHENVPAFARIYLDWENPKEFFGEKFITKLLRNKDVDKIINENKKDIFEQINEILLKKKVTVLGELFKKIKKELF